MRRVPLEPIPPPDHRHEAGYREWHQPVYGNCVVCDHPGRLERHHAITEQAIRREHGNPWDLRASVLLGAHCRCHSRHTTAAERLPASCLSEANLAFMVELLGEDRAADYVVRYYRAG